jgi:endo-1,4-beta-D-glucanase Y
MRRLGLVGAAAVVALAVAMLVRPDGSTRAAPEQARAAAQAFLTRYVEADGRVVRRDQGGDTVSEGQAYAMLLAAAIGDRTRFDRVWGWTRAHLQRDDGLLAWRPGDPQAAADADLDAARALLVAARRFHRPALAHEAHRLARAVGARETARVGGRRVLVAGPWARDRAVVNASYVAPRTLALLHERDLRASGLRIVRALQSHRSGLAPDWARATPSGATPIGTPEDPGRQAVFGYDAVRIPIRLAEDCQPSVRRDAAAARASLQRTLAPVRDLGGTPLSPGEHAVFAVAAAAATAAAGDRERAAGFLDRAAQSDRAHPTYYGAAWLALGRVMLTTRWLRGCPPM